jgi:predicted protein tyrosine phosphatase
MDPTRIIPKDPAKIILPHHIGNEHWSVVHALEDLDEDDQDLIKETLGKLGVKALSDTPPKDHARRIWDILENVAGAALGGSENLIADVAAAEALLDVIREKRIRAYTYPVSFRLIRGARPSPSKLRDLYYHNNLRSTINLCSEMHYGDIPIINDAELIGKLKTEHIPITDNGQPKHHHVLRLFEFLEDPDNIPAYMHCEQGVGRTGVMTACYRIAFNGWTVDDAVAEAARFADRMPEQLDFITKFGAELSSSQKVWGQEFRDQGYPKDPTEPSSVTPPGTDTRDGFLDPL